MVMCRRRRRASATMSSPPYIGSDLYDACLEMNWELAQDLARAQPLMAQFQEGDNLETPLYVACQNKPPESLIVALLQAWPQAVITKSRQGDLPLHIACRYQQVDDGGVAVIGWLVREYPETACRRTRWGATPLVALWERRSAQVRAVCNLLADRKGNLD